MTEAAEKKKVLLVEDDTNLGTLLQEYLGHKEFEVDLKRNGVEGLSAFKQSDYDILLLDVMMPKKDGFTMAEEVRAINSEVPIIFLTAKSMKEDKIRGLTLGADDYITKPFSMEVLELKMNAILRRLDKGEAEPPKDSYTVGDTTLDYKHQQLAINGESIHLTTKENELLRLFCERPNQVLEREVALNKVWNNDSYFTARSMDVFISKLRKYIRPDEKLSIVNVHGVGYKLVVN